MHEHPKNDNAHEELYQALVLDHVKNPRHAGSLPPPAKSMEMVNTLCGDRVEMFVDIENERLAAVCFNAKGCIMSRAAASMLSEFATGLDTTAAQHVIETFRAFLSGNPSFADKDIEKLGSLQVFAGVRRLPSRHRCVLLPFQALEKLLKDAA